MLLVNCFSLLCIQNVHLKCHGDIAVTGRRMKLELTMEQMLGNRESYWTEKVEDVRSVKKRVTTVSLRHLAQGCLIYGTWWGKGEHLELIHTPLVSSHTHLTALHPPQCPPIALYRPHHPPTRWHLHRVTTVTAILFLHPIHRHTRSNFHVTTLQHSFKGINRVRPFFF